MPSFGCNLYVLVEVQELQQSMEEVGKEGERAKEEVRVLTSRVAELEDVNKQVTGRLQQEQAEHEVSTHLQLVMMCMYIQIVIVGILESICLPLLNVHTSGLVCFSYNNTQIIFCME